MQTLKQWAVAVVAALAIGGLGAGAFGSPAAADEPGPNYQAMPQYEQAPVQRFYPAAPPPVIYGYVPPPAVVYYDYPPPVVVYPPRYRYAYGGFHPGHYGNRHHAHRHHHHHGHRHGRHWRR